MSDHDDEVLTALFDAWGLAPDERSDPKVREAVRRTFAYQRARLDDELRAFGRAGARKADRLARRYHRLTKRALRRARPSKPMSPRADLGFALAALFTIALLCAYALVRIP